LFLQVLQLVGAVLVLAGYTLAQLRRLDPQSIPYLVVNLVGSAILAALALHESQWGFLLLEGVWALVSLAGLIGRLRAQPG
jgi:drug/metabolite transporter (DMT)-like permease